MSSWFILWSLVTLSQFWCNVSRKIWQPCQTGHGDESKPTERCKDHLATLIMMTTIIVMIIMMTTIIVMIPVATPLDETTTLRAFQFS
jgi:hypothetical protein